MWFGDLATMRWWDDLWLNESFATYVSNLALAEATRFEGAWRAFHADMKRWGYQADARTHDPPDLGARPGHGRDLLQLRRDHLRQGRLRHQAARRRDRPGCLPGRPADLLPAPRLGQRHARRLPGARSRTGAGRSLRDWSRRWLETASLNTIEATWTARDGRVERLQLTQEAPEEHPTLRPHALELALVRIDGDGPAPGRRAIPARLEGAEAWVEAAVGRRRHRTWSSRTTATTTTRGSSWTRRRWRRCRGCCRGCRPAPAPARLGHAVGDGPRRTVLVAGLPGAGPDHPARESATTRSCRPGSTPSAGRWRATCRRSAAVTRRGASRRPPSGRWTTAPEGDLRTLWLRAAIGAVAEAADAARWPA